MKLFILVLRKEWLAFRRAATSIFGVLLYLLSVLFICAFVFEPNEEHLNFGIGLFWFILLFVALQAHQMIFNTSQKTRFYDYTLFPSVLLLGAKLLQQSILLFLLFLSTAFFYWFLLWQQNILEFSWILLLFLAALGFSGILTLLTALATRSSGTLGLLAVLGLPLMLPFLILLIRSSTYLFNNLTTIFWQENLIFLITIDIISLGLGLILFPYLWRD